MSGENLTMKQLHSVVDKTMYEADTNDDGRISFLEFSQVVESMDEFKKMVVQNVWTNCEQTIHMWFQMWWKYWDKIKV